jgi:hypothetical protein
MAVAEGPSTPLLPTGQPRGARRVPQLLTRASSHVEPEEFHLLKRQSLSLWKYPPS